MPSNLVILIFQFLVLIFSIMIHEVAHGVAALKLGDHTAERAGRLTLNPLKHIDPFGSIFLPLLLSIPALFGQPTAIIGWAKPVPYDPRHLKNPERAAGLIALAGPATNILVAFIIGTLIRFTIAFVNPQIIILFSVIVSLNLVLAIFNLLPIPPLDGSKVINLLLTQGGQLRLQKLFFTLHAWIRMYWFAFVIAFVLFFQEIMTVLFLVIRPVVNILHWLFTGFPSPFL